MQEYDQRNKEQEHADLAEAYGVFMVILLVVMGVCAVVQWIW